MEQRLKLKLLQPLKEFWNYFDIISVTLNMLESIHELKKASQIILKQFHQIPTR